jgi:serine protease Do
MYRTCLAFTLATFACSLTPELRAENKSALADALALEKAMQDAIQRAEPSIACILVSRSDAYRELFREQPPADKPGQLGPFNRTQVLHRAQPFRSPDDFQKEEAIRRKCDLADPDNVPEAYGSGVVIDDKDLLILTNYHVIRDATKIYVRLPGKKGSYADIHAADPRSDLAVLRLLDNGVRPILKLKSGAGGSVRKGQFVIALANPFAAGFRDGSPSASWGIVSNIQRRAAGDPEEDKQTAHLHVHPILLQTDARLNLGCSGGALLNLQGELIGLTTSRAAINGSETAGGFAIPLDVHFQRVVARLREGKEVEYGFLGVGPPRVGTEAGSKRDDGFRIGDVTPGSPAAKAALNPGESIVAVNGVRVHDFEDLVLTVGTLMAGSEVHLKVLNDNDLARDVTVKLAKFYVPGKSIASNRPPMVRGIRVDYTSVLMLRHSSRGQRAIIHDGVFISELQTASAAAAKLRLDDVITHVKVRDSFNPVNTHEEFYREVAKIKLREPLWLKLVNSPEPVRID